MHVAALTEVFGSFADYQGSIAEQLLLAGANPWTETFNLDMKRPAELADGGFENRVSCYHMAEVPSPENFSLADEGHPREKAKRGDYIPTAAQKTVEKAVFAVQDSTKLATDSRQVNAVAE